MLLLWQAFSQFALFEKNQKQLARQSVTGAANEISAYVEHLQHQVKIFAHDKLDTIKTLANNPENYDLFEQLNNHASLYFPNYFAITIANGAGNPILGNYDLLVNELCQTDIKSFSQSGFNYDIFIHPHPEVQHFDVMTPVNLIEGTSGTEVFFISFRPTVIMRFLGNAQILGHNLYLVKNNISGLVELSADGTRVDLIKKGKIHKLSRSDFDRTDYSAPVKGTRWILYSVADKSLYSEEKYKITKNAIYIYLVFIFISIMYLTFFSRLENRRKASETKLTHTKEQLQFALDFSRVGNWSYDIHSQTFSWSENANKILDNVSPQSIIDYIEIVSKSDKEVISQYFNDLARWESPQTIEHKISIPSGIKWIEMSGSIDKDDSTDTRIIGLIRNVTARKKAEEARIESEKKQRDTLIREVHHRIKNNLQGVIGLLRRHTKKGEINQAMIEHAISQLNSVSLIHGLSCESPDKNIYLSELTKAIIDAANNFTGSHIKLALIPDSMQYLIENEDDAIAVALVINELVFNAIKHSPSDIETVTAELKYNFNSAELTIKNKHLDTEHEFDFEKNIGLGAGLNLIKSLVSKNGANLVIKKQHDTVISTFNLTDPVISKYNENCTKSRQIA